MLRPLGREPAARGARTCRWHIGIMAHELRTPSTAAHRRRALRQSQPARATRPRRSAHDKLAQRLLALLVRSMNHHIDLQIRANARLLQFA